MLDCSRQEFVQLSNTDIVPPDSIILCEYITNASKSSCQCSVFDGDTPVFLTKSIAESDMSKNKATIEQISNATQSTPRQSSPQHKMCLPRNKMIQNAKLISSTTQQPIQIPIYLNEAQLALLNSKHSPKDASKQHIPDQGKTSISTNKPGGNITSISSTLQHQQLLAQHLHQHQPHGYLHHVPIGVAENNMHTSDHSGSNQNTAVSYLIPPNLLVSHNQLSQLHPRDLAIIQQKLLHQQHLIQQQHQSSQQQSGSSNQQLLCTCPSELHRAMHAQQQQQRLIEQRRLLAAQLSSMQSGQQIKLAPAAANTLPRDQHSSTHHIHLGKPNGQPQVTTTSQGFLCHNHQLSLQRQVESLDNANVTSVDSSESQEKDAHTCFLNNSADSGYSSSKDQMSSDTDSQIANIFSWIENVYGVKIIDFISRNYLQNPLVSDKCNEINGNEIRSFRDPRKIRNFVLDIRKEMDEVRIMLRRQYEFFKESLNQISLFIQTQGSQQLTDRIKLFEYNQAVLAHKIQTVQTSLSTYLSSEDKYQPEVLNNLSRNVADINDDFSKLQGSYIMIEKPIKFSIDCNSQNIDKHKSILTLASKGMVSSQNQLNNLNLTMSDLLRKQSLIKAKRKIANFPEEALESVISLREELHRDLLALTPDLEKRQSACEILETIIREKLIPKEFVESLGNFEEIVDDTLSAAEDMTPTREDSPILRNDSEIISLNTDDDNLPPPPPIEGTDESPVPLNSTDPISHIDLVADSIPMIDETPSSESFDDVYFNQPTIILVKPNNFPKSDSSDEKDAISEPRFYSKTGTILKTGSGQSGSSKPPKANKVVFCNTVTVEDGSETIRLNYPSEESDSDDPAVVSINPDDQNTLRKNPPPPPPRRTSQISSGLDNADGDVNYENLETFSSDVRHHLLHHNIVCVPLTVKAGINHSMDHPDGKQRRSDNVNMKPGKGKSLPSPSENDVWQRQTEFNTPTNRAIPSTPGSAGSGGGGGSGGKPSSSKSDKSKGEKTAKKK